MDAPQYSDLRAAMVSGQQGLRAIGRWVAEHAEELGPVLELPPGRVPSTATLRRAVRTSWCVCQSNSSPSSRHPGPPRRKSHHSEQLLVGGVVDDGTLHVRKCKIRI